jgi:hypothetical protein
VKSKLLNSSLWYIKDKKARTENILQYLCQENLTDCLDKWNEARFKNYLSCGISPLKLVQLQCSQGLIHLLRSQRHDNDYTVLSRITLQELK